MAKQQKPAGQRCLTIQNALLHRQAAPRGAVVNQTAGVARPRRTAPGARAAPAPAAVVPQQDGGAADWFVTNPVVKQYLDGVLAALTEAQTAAGTCWLC